jgi:hypothetical protein
MARKHAKEIAFEWELKRDDAENIEQPRNNQDRLGVNSRTVRECTTPVTLPKSAHTLIATTGTTSLNHWNHALEPCQKRPFEKSNVPSQ